MQTAEETRDVLPVGVDAGDEGQRRPEESVELLGETQENYAGVSVQVLDCGGDRQEAATPLILGSLAPYWLLAEVLVTALQRICPFKYFNMENTAVTFVLERVSK